MDALSVEVKLAPGTTINEVNHFMQSKAIGWMMECLPEALPFVPERNDAVGNNGENTFAVNCSNVVRTL